MEPSMPISRRHMIPIVGIALMALILPAFGQVSTACTASMLSSFTPCMNYITSSSGNGTSPTSDCCNALKGLTSTSMDCACLLVTASVPFQVPINRTLAVSLPKACNMAGVPVQCKASVAPVASPGPASLGPTSSESPSISPSAAVAPEPTSSAEAPESDTTTTLTPPSSTTEDGSPPTSSTGIRPVLTPSAAPATYYSISSSLVLVALGFLAMQSY